VEAAQSVLATKSLEVLVTLRLPPADTLRAGFEIAHGLDSAIACPFSTRARTRGALPSSRRRSDAK
jgi:hypothetical protein